MSASPKKTASKSKKPAKPVMHPHYSEMIKAAISALKQRQGSSRQAIVKYIAANYKVGDNVNVQVKMALKRMLNATLLVQTSGTGASGRFKLSKAAKNVNKPKPKKVVKKKPAAAKKPKKPAAKKTKKAAAKKAKRPAAKKEKKPAVKKPAAAKKPAAKKPAKKAAKKPAAKKAVKSKKPAKK